jgi:ubiquinone/menaquinone biosynthesis C-methylase UbiE
MQYQNFAEIYDYLMTGDDYDLWVDQIIRIFNQYNFQPRKTLELACGTGNITTRLYKKGYSIIGSDISDAMLEVANEKAINDNLRIRFINQDMRNITYNKKVDCVLSICDGLNYIITKEDLEKTFSSVASVLKPKGLFIFDLSTVYKYENIIGNNVFTENFEFFSYIWDNEYNKEEQLLTFNLTIFIETHEDLFERFIEEHKQKAHEINKIRELLKKDFTLLGIFSEEGLKEIKEKDERIFFVAQRNEEK